MAPAVGQESKTQRIKHSHACERVCARAHTHIHAHARAHTHTNARVRTYTYTHLHTHALISTRTYTRTCPYTHTFIHRHASTQSNTLSYTRNSICGQFNASKRTLKHFFFNKRKKIIKKKISINFARQ